MNCRACQAPIRFITMEQSGKAMPIDPLLVQTYLLPSQVGKPMITLITERGKKITGLEVTVTHPDAEGVEGYVPHWVSCTQPDGFRNR